MTFFDRAAAASMAGATPGMATDVARTTSNKKWSEMTVAEQRQATLMAQEAAMDPTQKAALDNQVVSNDGAPFELAQKYIYDPISHAAQGSMRTTNDATQKAARGGSVTNAIGTWGKNIPILGGWLGLLEDDPKASQERGYEQAKAAGASVSQTAWEIIRSYVQAGQKDNVGTWDAEKQTMVYPLLDDPLEYEARLEYFGGGTARWTTGVGDAIFNLGADPLNLVTAGGSAAMKGARSVNLLDVEAASKASRALTERAAAETALDGARKELDPFEAFGVDAADDAVADVATDAVGKAVQDVEVLPDVVNAPLSPAAADLTRKQRRIMTNVERLVDEAYRLNGESGSVDALSKSYLFKDSTDAGALAYLMTRASRTKDLDEAARKGLMSDIVYAGMGDQAAVARIAEQGKDAQLLYVELRTLQEPNWQVQYQNILHTPKLSIEERLALAGDDATSKMQLELQLDDVTREFDAYQRVVDQGTLGLGADRWAAREVTSAMKPAMAREIPLTMGRAYDDGLRYASVIKTLNAGRPGLRPMNLVSGRHMTGVLHLAADDAHVQFTATLDRASRALKGDRAAAEAMANFKDRFTAARGVLDAGVARSDRGQIVREYETYMMNRLAERYGKGDPERANHVRALIMELRGHRAADVSRMTHGMRQAVAKVDGAKVSAQLDEDGIWVYDEQLTKAFGGSLEQDVMGVQDWVRVDKFLEQYGRTGFSKWLHQTAQSTWVLSEAGLQVVNGLWKTVSLMRPVGYVVRNQIDTQLRLLSQVGAHRYLEDAFHGVKNYGMVAGRKATAAEAAAASERMSAAIIRDESRREIAMLERKALTGGDYSPVDRAPMDAEQVRASAAGYFDGAGIMRADEDAVTGLKGLADDIGMPVAIGDLNGVGLDEFMEGYAAWVRSTYDETLTRSNASHRTALAAAREREKIADEILNKPWEDHKAEFSVMGEKKWIGWEKTVVDGKVRLADTDFTHKLGKTSFVDRVTGEVHLGDRTDAYRSFDEYQRSIMRETQAANDNVTGLISGAADLTLRRSRSDLDFGLIEATKDNLPEWEKAYLNEVNKHLRSSGVMQRIIAGRTDADLKKWMRTDVDGVEFWRVTNKDKTGEETWKSMDEFLDYSRRHVEAMLPTEDAKIAALSRDLTTGDVRRQWTKVDDMPEVPKEPGEIAQHLKPLEVVGTAGANLRNWYFNWASSIPEARMGRHPFYQGAFKDSMDRMLKTAGLDKDAVSLDELNGLRKRADVEARRHVARYMFDTAQQSNLGYHMRFLMPFYSAWEDSMQKWGRLVAERPIILPLGIQAMQAPGSMFTVVDDDGNRIMPDGRVVNNSGEVVATNLDPTAGTMLIPIPGMKNPDDPNRNREIKIRRNSLNIMLQGEPFWLPGAGPMLAYPVNQLRLNVTPNIKWETPLGNTIDVGNWVQPFGVEPDPGPAGVNMFMPMWLRNLYQGSTALVGGNNSTEYVTNFNRFMAEIQTQVELGELEPMSVDQLKAEAGKRSRNYWVLRALGSQAPLSSSPDSEFQWYVDTYRQYLTEYGQADGDERFIADYPQYFNLTYSLSANNTGINAIPEAMTNARKYEKYFDSEESMGYGYVFAGAENLIGDFDQATYAQQKYLSAGPHNTEKYRDVNNFGAPLIDTQVSQGWREYREFTAQLDLVLETEGQRRGLTNPDGTPKALSLRMKDGEKYAELKRLFIEDLKTRNESWGSSFDDGFATDRPVQFLNYMAPILEAEPALAERSDMATLREYLAVRAQMRVALDQIGASNINSPEAANLAVVWDAFTASLIAKDVTFNQNLWLRAGLENDDLRQGVTS